MKSFLAVLLASLMLVQPIQADVPSRTINAAEKATVQLKIKVKVTFEDQDGKKIEKVGWGGCSGTYIAPHTILTAAHCVDMPDNVQMLDLWTKDWSGHSERAKIALLSIENDLALLHTETAHESLKLAQKRSLGESVWAVGNPLFMDKVISEGIISRVDFAIPGIKTLFFIITAPIFPGNSGGAALNRNGEVVGVVTRSTSYFGSYGASGLGFVVELKEVQNFLEYHSEQVR